MTTTVTTTVPTPAPPARRAGLRDRARDASKALIPRVNRLTERLGVRVQPVHYYSEVPDRRALRRDRGWARRIDVSGHGWDLDAQLAWLGEVCGPYVPEVAGLDAWRDLGSDRGPGYGPVESQVLHGVVRSLAPARILEVGSGVSTVIARGAADRNVAEGRRPTAITCIEPFPRDALRALAGVHVVADRAQDADRAHFDALGAGDVLFIDSTHALRTGSELARLYLEILPRLAEGVVVHIHDVYLPYLHTPDVLDNVFDWQETTLLAALLTDNPRLRVLACESVLHHDRPEALAGVLPDYRPRRMHDGLYTDGSADHFPSSIWLTRVGP
ncbi:class I SAM-dependent methyltransferase [Actinomycetospora sp. TBRC 11914]|uniref:class I SAM-dependent methyltransferase n=1 Tax=Actinomycetospora sp. TBRC 11914 TaxID=2729387 RepID=UPI00145D84AE|nr:class I SAM-dependent methyltransferase [Actinomycetospora sp. TBRC 11914]NMO90381.1 class I SAM-dependent methyltransferase [Actinomycetospora sp. TBRC 11914]